MSETEAKSDQEKERTDGDDEGPVLRSRVPEIWEKFFQQMDEIDTLENRLNEHATRVRRRTASLLDQTPTHRRSHLRMFVTHKYDMDQSRWTLVIEGKLLIGHLDHRRAAQVDQEGELSKAKTSAGSPKDGGSVKTTVITPTATTATPKSETEATTKSDRSQYRTVGEKEEDPVEPIFFTHLFDRLVVVFRTIYQPKNPPNASSSFSAAKKSRSTKRKVEKQDLTVVNPKHLRASEPTELKWSKEDSSDAHAFFVNYTNDEMKRPPPPEMKFHSVVATISLLSTRSEKLYRPSPALAEKFFPKHKDDSERSSRSGDAKRRKIDDGVETTAPIPLENEIIAPSLLTMNEIIMALFQYIQDKNLSDSNDKSLILCDKVLSSLLDCESISFADLQQTLLSKELVVPVEKDESPIVLTYIMNERTTSPQSPLPKGSPDEDPDEDSQSQVLSFDTDVWLPSLLHYRSRDLLRRIKRREFEYTSSRTKARYLLVASRGNEDIVKNKIEQAVSGRGYSAENIPVFLALAKAAPPDSEARGAAQIDAKMCALMERLGECSRRAEASWELVEALNRVAGQSF